MPNTNHSVTQMTELLPRRKKRQPRVLNYQKCRLCRDPRVKSKCVWEKGPWPNKCKRCIEKKLPCSRPCHKADEYREDLPPKAIASQDEEESSNDHLILQLLALHTILLMALEEFKSLTNELLRPLMHDPIWKIQRDFMIIRYDELYGDFAKYIQEYIVEKSSSSKLAMKAALDIACFSQLSRGSYECAWPDTLDELNRTTEKYAKNQHFGMATVLLMYQSSGTSLDSNQVSRFIRCHEKFLSEMKDLFSSDFMDRDKLERENIYLGFELLIDSSLFFPRKLLHYDPIRAHIRATGLKDCLGRTASLLEYDAGLVSGSGTDLCHENGHFDHLGRSLLHVACILEDRIIVTEWTAHYLSSGILSKLGLYPLHIAASKGNMEIFRKLHDRYEEEPNFGSILNQTDDTGRTFFEWAASCGHHNIVEFYLAHHKFQWGFDRYWTERVSLKGTVVIEAFKAALRHDRLEVVEVMTKHLRIFSLSDNEARTPFWWAVHYQRLDAMRMLESFCDVEHIHLGTLRESSPFLEAARNGFTQGIRYLLSLNTHGWLRVHPDRTDKNGKTARQLALENGHDECALIIAESHPSRRQI